MNEDISLSHSPDIREFVSALAKAQGVIKPAAYNKINPHFKSKYADFSSCMEACRIPLSENGIAVIQYCATIESKLNLVTMLAHVSGQWMKSEFPLISAKMDSQGIGAAMTYAKRYSLCGMIGIVADEDLADDDGETAVGRGKNLSKVIPGPSPVEPPKEALKILSVQREKLKELEDKLDDECKDKLNKWLKNTYQIDNLKDITVELYITVYNRFENAVKYLEQKNTLEVAHA